MSENKRNVLFEKYIHWDYIDNLGRRLWVDKYGEVIKAQRSNGSTIVGFPGVIHNQWSVEMANDLAAFHGIDVEAELTNLLAAEIANRIDHEIIAEIRNAFQL